MVRVNRLATYSVGHRLISHNIGFNPGHVEVRVHYTIFLVNIAVEGLITAVLVLWDGILFIMMMVRLMIMTVRTARGIAVNLNPTVVNRLLSLILLRVHAVVEMVLLDVVDVIDHAVVVVLVQVVVVMGVVQVVVMVVEHVVMVFVVHVVVVALSFMEEMLGQRGILDVRLLFVVTTVFVG